jgi:hypothetical protein
MGSMIGGWGGGGAEMELSAEAEAEPTSRVFSSAIIAVLVGVVKVVF